MLVAVHRGIVDTFPEKGLGKRLLSGGAWVAGARTVTAVCGMLVSILLARMLEPQMLGVYFIVASIGVTGAMLAQFGTHQSVVRLTAGHLAKGESSELRRSLRAVATVALIGSVVVAGGYVVGAGELLAAHVFESPALLATIWLAAGWIVLRQAQVLISQAFRGFHDLRQAAILSGSLTQLLLVSMLAVLWRAEYPIELSGALTTTLVAYGITVVYGGWWLQRRYWRHLEAAKGLALRPVAKLSAPLFVSSASFMVLGEMHLWVLGAQGEPEQVALYGAAYRLMQLVLIPLSLVNNVIPPTVAQLYTQGRHERLEQVMRASASLAALPALMVLVLLILFAEPVLVALYGEYFGAAAILLAILAVGQGINVLTGSPGVLMAMSDQQQILMRVSLGGGVIGLLLSLTLVGPFGAAGVACGYASGLVLQNVAMALYCRARLGVNTFAGWSHLRDPVFWLRGELGRRAQHKSIFLRAEAWLRRIENGLCRLLGKTVVECMGDSHVNMFTRVNRCGCVPGVYFRISVARGATASGITNPDSRTNADRLFSHWLSRIPGDHPILYMLGEVGIEFQTSTEPQADETNHRNAIGRVMKQYCGFLECEYSRHPRFIVVSVPLPAVRDDDSGDVMERPFPGLSASQQERASMTLEFNARLREWVQAKGGYFLDLDSELLDSSAGLLRDEFRKPDKVDNHLEPDAFTALLCRRLSSAGFRAWLGCLK